MACTVLGGLQPFRVRLTVEPVWPAVNGVPARSNGRLSPTLLAWKLAETGGGQPEKFFFTLQPACDDAGCRGGIIAQAFGLVLRDPGFVYTFFTQAQADRDV